jgi:hypothetical protein
MTVKGFIGLAGPYDISDHYEHEFKRGIYLFDLLFFCLFVCFVFLNVSLY